MCTNMEVLVKRVLYFVVIYVFKYWIHTCEGCSDDTFRMLHCPSQDTTMSKEVSLERCNNDSWTPVCAETMTLTPDHLERICKEALKPNRNPVTPEIRLSRTGHACNRSTPLQNLTDIPTTTYNVPSDNNCTQSSFIFCRAEQGFADEPGEVFASFKTVSWNQSRIMWGTSDWMDRCDNNLCGQGKSSVSYGWALNEKQHPKPDETAWTTSAFVYQGKKLQPKDRTPDFNATALQQCANICLNTPQTIKAVAFSSPDCYCINKTETEFTEIGSIDLYHLIEKTQVPQACQPFDETPRLCIAWIGLKGRFEARECGQYLPALCASDKCHIANQCGGMHVCSTYMADPTRCVCNCNGKQDVCIIDSNRVPKNYSNCYCLDAAGNQTQFKFCPDPDNRPNHTIPPKYGPFAGDESSTNNILLHLIISLSLSFVVISAVILVISYVVVRKRRRRKESQVSNATTNRTYGDNALVLSEQETYAMVGDLDPDLDKAFEPSAPLLPQRKKMFKNGIATLEEYSCPNDFVGNRYSDSNGYAMTYDDTRRKRTKSDGDLNFSKLHSSQLQECPKVSRKPFSSEKNKSKQNLIEASACLYLPDEKRVQFVGSAQHSNSVIFRNSQNTHKCHVCHEEEKAKELEHQNCVNSTTKRDNTITSGRPRSMHSQGKNTSAVVFSNKDDRSMLSGDSDCEDTSITVGDARGRLTSRLSTDSYEDTSLATTSGHNCTKKSPLFQEHVCLDCIPQEVLRTLGIRIVAEDDVYDTYYNFRRSLDRVYDEEKVYRLQGHAKNSQNYFILAKPTANAGELRGKVKDEKSLNDMVYDAIDRNRRRPTDGTNVYDHISHLKRPSEIVRLTQHRRYSL